MRAEWIWYPHDFAWAHYHRVMHSRRQRRSGIVPSWRTDGPYDAVTFRKEVDLAQSEDVRVIAEGRITVNIDYAPDYVEPEGDILHLPAGKHVLYIGVVHFGGLCSLFVQGDTVSSGEGWEVNCGNTDWVKAETGGFADPASPPGNWRLPARKLECVFREKIGKGMLFDFGRETMARLFFSGCKPGKMTVCYGESREEALDAEHCETLDDIVADECGNAETPIEMGMRYAFVFPADEKIGICAKEYLVDSPVAGDFSCSDPLIGQIYNVARATYRITEREFFFDGLKRDRWVWSGDVFQSEMMDFYTDFDLNVLRRSLLVLGGKCAPDFHINTILDYTLYWMIALHRYAYYTGDEDFIRGVFPRAAQYLEFCMDRENADGFLCGREGDWVFVDWADIDNRGEVCVEQILYAQALRCMAELSKRCMGQSRADWKEKSSRLVDRIRKVFWQGGERCFVHGRIDGKLSEKTTRYANIFALLFGFLDESERHCVIENVLKNPNVQQITTPYMKFYELSALAEAGETEAVLRYMRDYWGGMLVEGATTFWEEYKPGEHGIEKYAMYGRRYGKSLCHAWGASPLYLLGRYIAGVRPAEYGYRTFAASPVVGAFTHWKCTVPVSVGTVTVEAGKGFCKILSTDIGGELTLPPELRFTEGGSRMEVQPGRPCVARWEDENMRNDV